MRWFLRLWTACATALTMGLRRPDGVVQMREVLRLMGSLLVVASVIVTLAAVVDWAAECCEELEEPGP